jgi:hypothetical protein
MPNKLVLEILAQKNALDLLNRNGRLSQVLRVNGVVRSKEFLRVRDLPRRQLATRDGDVEGERLARAVSDMLYWAAGGKGPSPLPLRVLQAAMLCEAAEHNGLTASLAVGSGKSWVAPMFATDYVPPKYAAKGSWPQILCDRPVMLIPPNLRPEVHGRVIPTLKNVYRIHPNLKVVAYSELQTQAGVKLLEKLKPDLLICDEVHYLKNLTSARTKRVRAYLKEQPQTRFIGMSGTITAKSLRDYWHLMMWSHPMDTPLPMAWRELEDWANAIDADVPQEARMPPGVLVEFCTGDETPREGLRRRLTETSGVVASTADALGTSLVVRARRDLTTPSNVQAALADLRAAWITPDGDEIPDPPSLARHAKELALGFYYRWRWPNGEPDREWLEARAGWRRMVREVVRRGMPGLDTELLVRNATRRHALPKSLQEDANYALAAWDEQSKKPEPETEPVWLSDFAMQWVAAWAERERGIVWFEFQAVADALEAFPVFRHRVFRGGTDDALVALASGSLGGTMPIACSAFAHATGKNLQAWNKNLVLTAMPNGGRWEQLLGRTHRPGQDADEVQCDFLAHQPEAFAAMKDAIESAVYVKETTGAPQKLLLCSAVDWAK